MAIDILAAFEQEPQPQDFILPGFLSQTVGALIAPGSTGKSFLAMQIAAAIAGGDTLNLGIKKTGRVTYYNAEDPEDEIVRRLHSLGSVLSPEQRQNVADNLVLEPICGLMQDLSDDVCRRNIIEFSKGSRLIIFDTISRLHTLEENDNGAMARLLNILENIARETGAGVLFLHHTSKAAVLNQQADLAQAARGAGALIDNARWCGYLQKMTEAESQKLTCRMDRKPVSAERLSYYVRYGVSKQNYGGPVGESWFERGEGGILKPCYLKDADKDQGGKNGYSC